MEEHLSPKKSEELNKILQLLEELSSNSAVQMERARILLSGDAVVEVGLRAFSTAITTLERRQTVQAPDAATGRSK